MIALNGRARLVGLSSVIGECVKLVSHVAHASIGRSSIFCLLYESSCSGRAIRQPPGGEEPTTNRCDTQCARGRQGTPQDTKPKMLAPDARTRGGSIQFWRHAGHRLDRPRMNPGWSPIRFWRCYARQGGAPPAVAFRELTGADDSFLTGGQRWWDSILEPLARNRREPGLGNQRLPPGKRSRKACNAVIATRVAIW